MLSQQLDRSHLSRSASGFTLIEMMVVVVIMGVSATLAAPEFSRMIGNYRVRSGAESMISGINYARAEAVRRNAVVSFSLTGGGSGWVVSQVSPSTELQSRSNNDSPGTTVTSTNASTSVAFLPTGLVQTGTQLTQIVVSSSTTGTDSRRINIFGGGLIRMCDPNASGANDPRRC